MLETFGLFLLALLGISFPLHNSAIQVKDRPELGSVAWKRNLEEAKKLSAETGKPIFVQFQEVPG